MNTPGTPHDAEDASGLAELSAALGPQDSVPSLAPVTRARWVVWGWLVLVLVIVGGIGFAGAVRLDGLHTETDRAALEMLATVADLKVGQIAGWMKDRRGDAATFLDYPHAREYLADPANAAVRRQLLQAMVTVQQAYDYRVVALLDASGAVRLSVPTGVALQEPDLAEHVQRALPARDVVFSDLHRHQPSGSIQMSYWIPVGINPRAGERAAGVLVLQVDPRRFLYPLIQGWPTLSHTAETLLIRREGHEVVFLNDLRHRTNTAMVLRMPVIAKQQLPAGMAVQGYESAVEGVDYRGIPVLAAMRKIPGTPWFIVAKIDHEEIYTPLRQKALASGMIAGLVLLAVSLAGGVLGRQQQLARLRNELAERQRG